MNTGNERSKGKNATDARGNALIFAAILVVLVGFAFAPSLQNGFINYDDPDYLTSNPHVQKGLSRESILWAFTTDAAANWHPLTWLSHMLDWQLFGERPGGHHLTSVILHGATTLLLFLWLLRTTRAPMRSFLVAAFFSVHPLRVESVAWASERKDVLSGLFFMLTILAFTRYAELRRTGEPGNAAPLTRRSSFYYVLALSLFALGLMSKPMLVTLPCVLLLLDYWPLQTRGGLPTGGIKHPKWSLLFAEKIPFFIFAAASSAITITVQKAGGATVSIQHLSLFERLENSLISYVRYLGKTFYPQDLSAFYPIPQAWIPGALPLAIAVLSVITAAVFLNARKRPFLLVGWLWFVGMLVPVIGIVKVGGQSIADRYTYLPSIGLFIAIVWSLREWSQRWRKPWLMSVGAAAVILLGSHHTRRQVAVWRDSETLFRHALKSTEDNWLAHGSLALALRRNGQVELAIEHYREAIRIRPDYAEAHNNLGAALLYSERFDEAINHFQQAIRLRPRYDSAYNNLGGALFRLGRIDEAADCFAWALTLNPDNQNARRNLDMARQELMLQSDPAQ